MEEQGEQQNGRRAGCHSQKFAGSNPQERLQMACFPTPLGDRSTVSPTTQQFALSLEQGIMDIRIPKPAIGWR